MELVLFQEKPYRTNTNVVLNKLFLSTLQLPLPVTVCTTSKEIQESVEKDKTNFFLRVLFNPSWKVRLVKPDNDQALLQVLSQEHEQFTKKIEAFLEACNASNEPYLAFVLHLKGVQLSKPELLPSFTTRLRSQQKSYILRDALLETPHILLLKKENAKDSLLEILQIQQQQVANHMSLLESGPFVFASALKELKAVNGDQVLQRWSKGKQDVELVDMDLSVEGPTTILQQFIDAQIKEAPVILSSIDPSFLSSQQMNSSSSAVAWIFLAVIAIIFVVAIGITWSRAFPNKVRMSSY